MKRFILHIPILILITLFCACDKDNLFPGNPTITPFEINVASLEYKVGEPITFKFQGNADTIYFYSGEVGKDYNYKDGRFLNIEDPMMNFSTQAKYGLQKGQLSILISSKFNGDYSNANVASSFVAGDWNDITDKFVLSSKLLTNGTYEGITAASGIVSIKEFIDDKPYYIAVRNKVEPASVKGAPVQWAFYNTFKIAGNSSEGTSHNLIAFADADWHFVRNGEDNEGKSITLAATSISFFRNPTSPVNLTENALDNWAITRPIKNIITVSSGDKGAIIKRITDLPLENYNFAYTVPGDYDVTFYTINQNKESSLVKMKIKITL